MGVELGSAREVSARYSCYFANDGDRRDVLIFHPFMASMLLLGCGGLTMSAGEDASPHVDGRVPLDARSGRPGDAGSAWHETGSAADVDAKSTDAGSTDAQGDASVVCNTVVNQGPEVQAQVVQQAAPVATGGTVVDGMYVLTSQIEYAPGASVDGEDALTIVVAGSTWQEVATNAVDGGLVTARATFAWTVAGTAFGLMLTCPQGAPGVQLMGTYTASPTEIILYFLDSSSSEALTLTKL